jgi:hypothetical protein
LGSRNLKKKGHNKLVLKTNKLSSSKTSETSNQNSGLGSSKSPASSIAGNKEEHKPDASTTAESDDKKQIAKKDVQPAPGSAHHEQSREEASARLPTVSEIEKEVTPSEAMSAAKHRIMERRGHNQLILATGKKHKASHVSVLQPLHRASSKDCDDPVKEDTAGTVQGKMPMKRLGHHKLVLNNERNDLREQKGILNEDLETNDKVSGGYNDTKQVERKWNRNAPPSNSWSQRNTNGQAPFRRNHPRHNAAKRIKLTVQPSGLNDGDEDTTQDTSADNNNNNNNNNNEAHTTEKLTDFAYRETARKRQGRYHGQQRNMGLVRVQPNVKRTPICPTFLRGVECTDKYCRKRHDVPKEFAIPICSFFQRRGQCLKGDECVFRHVKVNPRAMVCPSFSLLGFCDDESCSMKHMREKPNA